MTNPQLTVFIGYDERQSVAFEICKQSILDNLRDKDSVIILPLKHSKLRQEKLFDRPWTVKESGEFIDNRDGKPFSTQFSHSRFLVPHMARTYTKTPWAVFVDSDFVFLSDITDLITIASCMMIDFPVYVVKHNYTPSNTVKMDNRDQHRYNMKLWTSLMLFNVEHPGLDNLTPEYINSASGMNMHQFKWLGENPSHNIGSLPETWNFIPNHSEKNFTSPSVINAIHYTEGTPHMEGYEHCELSSYYWEYYLNYLYEETAKMTEGDFI